MKRRDFLKSGMVLAAELNSPHLVADEMALPPTSSTDDENVIRKLLQGKSPITWVFTGDSITHGALHTRGWRSYPEHFAERVRWELRRMRDIVINTGISGETAGGLLADVDWRALRFKPRVVSIMIGTNDCSGGPDKRDAYLHNLEAIVQKVRSGGAIPLLNTPNTIYSERCPDRADLPAYVDIMRTVAEQHRVTLVDHWDFWMKSKPTPRELLTWLEDGTVHPNVYGHRAFARMIFKKLGIFDEQSPTCQLPLS